MSRIDYITLAIVLVCLVVLVYVLVRVANLNSSAEPVDSPAPPDILTSDTVRQASLDSLAAQLSLDSMARVQPAEKAEVENPAPRQTVPAKTGRYLVVAASFPSQEEAQAELIRFQRWGYDEAELGFFNAGKIVAVIVGRYASNAEARERVRELQRERDVEAYVHLKRE